MRESEHDNRWCFEQDNRGIQSTDHKLRPKTLALALSNKGTVDAFSVARPSLANSLRSNRGERATAGSDEGTHSRRAYPVRKRCWVADDTEPSFRSLSIIGNGERPVLATDGNCEQPQLSCSKQDFASNSLRRFVDGGNRVPWPFPADFA